MNGERGGSVGYFGGSPYVCSIHNSKFNVESDLSNALSWLWISRAGPWKFGFFLNEIKALSSLIQVELNHILRSTNAMADSWPNKERITSLLLSFLIGSLWFSSV